MANDAAEQMALDGGLSVQDLSGPGGYRGQRRQRGRVS